MAAAVVVAVEVAAGAEWEAVNYATNKNSTYEKISNPLLNSFVFYRVC